MKNFRKTLALLLCVILLAISMTGCSIFSNGQEGGGGAPVPQKQSITVYKDELPLTYTVTVGEVAQIDIPQKPGYYFVGAYDAAVGGTQYFNAGGQSSMVWAEGSPAVYYARFESVSNLTYSLMRYEEDPYCVDWHEKYLEFEFTDELKNAIAANLDEQLTVTVSLKVTCDDRDWGFGKVGIANMEEGGERTIIGEHIGITAGQYTPATYTTTISARLVNDGKIYVYVHAKDYYIQGAIHYYVKNVAVQISFAE